MAKIQLYAESKTIKLTKQQANSLNVLKSYNVDVSRFIKRSVNPIGQLCCRWDVSDTPLHLHFEIIVVYLQLSSLRYCGWKQNCVSVKP